jgi:hypothetical protein
MPMLGGPSPTDGHPKLAAWWTKVQGRPMVQEIPGEQQQGLVQLRETGRLS